ncbi:hypothetical protein D3C81_1541880 [compost metagenome]
MFQLLVDRNEAIAVGQADPKHAPHQLENSAQLVLPRFNRHPIQLIQHIVQKMRVNVGLQRFDFRLTLLFIPPLQRAVQLFDLLHLLAVPVEEITKFVLVIVRQIHGITTAAGRATASHKILTHRHDETLDRLRKLAA